MKSKLILVTGGARSGKSSYAESLVTAYSKGREEKAAYLATAQALDQEMTERIRKHSSSRPRGWQTYEEPFWPHKAFQQAAEAGKEVMLLDCLTMLTSNWLCRLAEPGAAAPLGKYPAAFHRAFGPDKEQGEYRADPGDKRGGVGDRPGKRFYPGLSRYCRQGKLPGGPACRRGLAGGSRPAAADQTGFRG